jgi:hypothetical protein
LREYVFEVGARTAGAAAAEGSHAAGIVELPLVLVAEDLVGLGHGLELDLGLVSLLLGNLVRVVS